MYGGAGEGVVVNITSSNEDAKQNCVSIFRRIISCVMEAKEDFCHSIKPQFFLFDPSQSADYLHEDNLFAMSDVRSVLSLPPHKGKVVLSITGERKLMREKIAFFSRFTLWNSLFSLDFSSVHHYLKDVVYGLFIHLGLPRTLLDTIEANFSNDLDRRRIELVDAWISSSSDPPCWWHLVQALKKGKYGCLAQELETQYSKCSVVYSCTIIQCIPRTIVYELRLYIGYTKSAHKAFTSTTPLPGVPIQLQRNLLDPEKQSLRPDKQFLELLAGVVKSECPSLIGTYARKAYEQV